MAEANTPVAQFAPADRPAFPGSPFTPWLPGWHRVAYAGVGVLTGICSTFGNALVNVNVANISGSLGLYVAQASWLPAIYVAMNATANLTLVKARAQFGIPAVMYVLLLAYVLTDVLQFAAPGFAAAALIRAVDGMMAAALTTIAVYYWVQALPSKLRPLALVIGVGLPQLGNPLARLIPVEMLAVDHWHGLHLMELAIALTVFAAIFAFPLPPTERTKAFEPLDVVTISLVVSGMVLLCGVLGVGRVLWWEDTPLLGWAIVISVPLIGIALLIETHRRQPLIQIGWLSSVDILRFAAVAILVRLALAEQTYGSVGLLTSGGLTNDQLHGLFATVAVAMVAGILTAAVTLSERRLPWQVMIAALIIALGAWIDSHANNLTRPPQLFLSQALIGFGTTLFIGPALIYGFIRMFKRGSAYLTSFVVLFSVTQNVGGLVGSAALGTYEVIEARAHAGSLSDHLLASDPNVVARIRLGAGVVADVITDPAQRLQGGGGLLMQALDRESAVLAYNDVFWVVTTLSLATALYIAYLMVFSAARRRRQYASEEKSDHQGA
jgi:hypothetical protein